MLIRRGASRRSSDVSPCLHPASSPVTGACWTTQRNVRGFPMPSESSPDRWKTEKSMRFSHFSGRCVTNDPWQEDWESRRKFLRGCQSSSGHGSDICSICRWPRHEVSPASGKRQPSREGASRSILVDWRFFHRAFANNCRAETPRRRAVARSLPVLARKLGESTRSVAGNTIRVTPDARPGERDGQDHAFSGHATGHTFHLGAASAGSLVQCDQSAVRGGLSLG